MGFRFRLASFFVVALILVQGLTGVLVYQVTRHELIGEGQRQLQESAQSFAHQFQDMSDRAAASVQVLALDFALRSAVAQRDEATLTSALRNHGRRVGATQMLVIGVDGRVEVDTAGQLAAGTPFPHADLVERALQAPAAATVTWKQRAYWMVVVPVFAPDLVGYIGAAIPVDDRVLARLQQQSALPDSIELAAADASGRLVVLARGRDPSQLAVPLAARGSLPTAPVVVDVGGREFVSQAVWLRGARHSPRVAAVLGFSVDEALRPYRPVAAAWAGLLAFGLTVGLVCAWLIARSVSRPIEELAALARRIASGDYSPPEAPARTDELGQLANAFGNMAHAIREREARILHQAGHDHVTGLPNRAYTETAIQHALAARPDGTAALLMLGLGRLPEIIKTLGHVVSDRLMHEAGVRLQQPADSGLVARATDTQLSIFLPGAGRGEAIEVAHRIVEALGEPYREADLTLDFAPAVGIALAPQHGTDASGLLRRAEVAMLGALHSDDPTALYDPSTDPHRPERLSLMADLRHALENEGISLHYQPKLNLREGRIDSAEGLIRWRHPIVGPVAPDAFIALAEETGNIRRVTRWALGAGIAQAGRWKAEGHAVRLSINVSARDLDSPDLPARINELLRVHAVAPAQIVLEITESAIMGKPEAAIAVLRRLADDGIDLAIDDFGVGQSSFAYLRRLPVRELKIDKTFITHLAHSREDRIIVSSIVELGHHLGYRVTAEGVDDAAALDYLREIGCDHAQGYLIAPPLAVDDFGRLLNTARWPLPAATET
ncbi:putative bifunctional diguanylate cyclase/phosphodiesterase [Montanilutibacter psychrotolerans]|uniref:EAL domain-containing protein n=1 Tax=Montanilutibacter psychrotolerans TaxID=1327343 RepID=A0A3M8T5M3_9GAMM|nr:bifunctional diguanylate cyclase/phosphodiesterase [Lysobacter psychrotolerans]RNF86500.1 EAL domain-containing protein [Lysobacter psychrotolerans]